ncbi:hypothetical protein [Nakamurella sp.]|uniref:hypothetical protein n=1 Tax=Nakamurella sp. TaxID=1869182 RepID=UPI003B3A2712
MIPRRVAGALILVVGLTVALVLPAVAGRRITGTASRPPVPDPPVVGDCLTAPLAWAASPLILPVVLATAPVAACSATPGSSFGEVVLVTRPAAPAALGAFEWDDCAAPLQTYLGWPSSRWRPAPSAVLALLGPDAEQVEVGQAWVACAITTGALGYAGSVRDGFGPAADRYGDCDPTRPFDPAPRPCDEPHEQEAIGRAVVGFDDLAGLDASCADLVRRRTGLPDPTAGGRLAVLVAPVDPNTVPPDVSAGGQTMTCGVRVVGPGKLTASLVGIGDRPLPLS